MELKLIRGCVHDNLTVDGKQEIHLTDEERQKVLDAIFNVLEPKDLNYVLQKLVEVFGEYKLDDTPCECCGDFVEEYTWNV